MAEERKPIIIPVKFWQEYATGKDGETITREFVELTKPGMMHSYGQVERITNAFKECELFRLIEPAYDAWKRGQDAPEMGTPLGAWPAINQEIAAAFRAVGLRTVEEVEQMNENVMNRVRLPNVRRWRDEAKAFLNAKEGHGAAMRLQQQADEIAALKAQMAELIAMQSGGDEAPKRRGRPPKVQEPEAIEEDEAA